MADTLNKKTLTVNQFPTLTWNFLKINNSKIEVADDVFESSCAVAETELPSGVTYNDGEISTLCTNGMGKSVDALFDAYKDLIPSAVYTVAENTEAVVKLSYNVENGDNVLTDVVIRAGENSKCTFIMDYSSDKDAKAFAGWRTQIIAEANAVVKVVKVQLLGNEVDYFDDIGSSIADSAHVDVIQLSLGGKQSWIGNYATVAGYQSEVTGKLAYVCRENQFLDVNYVAHHTGRETISKMYVDGILSGNAKKTWRGTIDLCNGAHSAKGDEQENVLLFNPEVENKSLPVILCDEEDVEGHHGASVGKLGADLLFYMQTRGVDQKEAQKMLVKAKISSLTRDIPDEALVETVHNYIEEVFNYE